MTKRRKRRVYRSKEDAVITNICRLLESRGYRCHAVDHSVPNWKRPSKDIHGADIIATCSRDMRYIQVDTFSFRSKKAKILDDVPMPLNIIKEFWVCIPGRPYSVRDLEGRKLREETPI